MAIIFVLIFMVLFIIFIFVLSLFFVDKNTDYEALIRDYKDQLEHTNREVEVNDKIIRNLKRKIKNIQTDKK